MDMNRAFNENWKNTKKVLFGVISFSFIFLIILFLFDKSLITEYLSSDGKVSDVVFIEFNRMRTLSIFVLLILSSISLYTLLFSRHALSVIYTISNKTKAINIKLNKDPRKYFIIGLLICCILLGIGLRILAGKNKAYYHYDETKSLEYINNVWLSNLEDLIDEDYVEINKDTILDVYKIKEENQLDYVRFSGIVAKEPHPPLYLWALHSFQSIISDGAFSRWPGIILNIIMYIISSIYIFKLATIFFKDKYFSILPVLFFILSPVTISGAIFLRMYEVFLTFTIITIFYSYKFLFHGQNKVHALLLFFTILLGLITQYFYLIFMFWFTIGILIHTIQKRKLNVFFQFFIICILAGIISLYINPSMINNLLFDHWGSNAIQSAASITNYLINIVKLYILFDLTLLSQASLFLVTSIVLFVLKRKRIIHRISVNILIIAFIGSFLTIAKVAPFQVMRYYYNLIPVLLLINAAQIYILLNNHRLERILLSFSLLILFCFQVTVFRLDLSMTSTFFQLNSDSSKIGKVIKSEETPILVVINKDVGFNDHLLPFLSNKESIFLVHSHSLTKKYSEIRQLYFNEELIVVIDKYDQELENMNRILEELDSLGEFDNTLFYRQE